MKHERCILALDQGTTSSRAVLINSKGQIHAWAQMEFPQHYHQPGWVEHDPHDLWKSQFDVIAQAMRQGGLKAESIAAIGITNQRETTLVWDRATGEPLGNAIVWQDR
ncbi:MAG: glycerol kinase, partial [Sedimentisphaerales bacterium]|nr:glycerol kinase [Sedimentisphaerales bacterium]